jgi:hypothetical protein
MDLLAGYGSRSESEPETSPEAAPQVPAPSTRNTTIEQEEKAISAALPAPASSRQPLFSGLPSKGPAVPLSRRKITAKVTCGIDYGDLKQEEAEEEDDYVPAAKRMKPNSSSGPRASIASFLPAPKNASTKAPPSLFSSKTNNKFDDDDDLVPGAEDPSGMYLGKGDGSIEEDDDAIPLNAATTTTTTTTTTNYSQFIHGEYNGVEYLYDPNTGQYYYPENTPTTTTTTTHQSATAGIEASLGMGDIQFKEISGAQLRYMDPGQKAELNALRSALGDDYEAKLKSDAAKVGNVSKLAKRKHQLASLYVQSKEQELEDMEKRASGAKTKAETQKKYGW